MKFWHKASNWTKARDMAQGIAAIAQISFAAFKLEEVWHVAAAIFSIVVLFFRTWGEDKDNDGRVDAFQEEVITTITTEKGKIVDVDTAVNPKDDGQ